MTVRGVRVRVPATSANLGPGFDSLGLALFWHDVVEAWVTDSGLSIEVAGEGADTANAGEAHLVVKAMRQTFEILDGRQPPGLALRCANRIPHARGLGSSAAAIVSGVLAARALADDGPQRLPDEAVLRLAAGLEGHPDNVAACLLGGLTVAWTGADGPRAVRLSPLRAIVPVVIVAPEPLSTTTARGVLPDQVPHPDAATNAGRSALLIAALTSETASGTASDPGPLLDATEDRLHQPYRAGVMPETATLIRRLRDAGVPAVVSGAGPSVLAFLVRPEAADAPSSARLDVLDSTVRDMGIGWDISALDVDRRGASIQLVTPDQEGGPVPAGGTPP
ncbi:MAG TPA: homoserine kinase [Streptosporangiaceae bacterium]|jgi:homoserine kinase|nr:homoserine kinase [Streptosporangiaceae bacterium]